MINVINTFDGSKLGGNLVTSYHVDNMSSVLIPAESKISLEKNCLILLDFTGVCK